MTTREAWSIHRLRLPGGESVTVRPAGPQDADRLQAFVRALSSTARYNRFHGPLNELSPGELDRATRASDWRTMTLLAEVGDGDARTIIGEVRYAMLPGERTCELAISVADG